MRMVKICCGIWCLLMLSLLSRQGVAQRPTVDLFSVIVFVDGTNCVDEQMVKNIQVDAENFPVRFNIVQIPAIWASSEASSDRSGAAMRQSVAKASANAGLWFSCNDGTVHLLARLRDDWLTRQRLIEVEKGQLNPEGLSAVIYGWLETLVPLWQQNVSATAATGAAVVDGPRRMVAPPIRVTAAKRRLVMNDLQKPLDAQRKADIWRPDAVLTAPRKNQRPVAADVPQRDASGVTGLVHVTERTARARLALELDGGGAIVHPGTIIGGVLLSAGLRPWRGKFETYAKGGIFNSQHFTDAPLQLTVRSWPIGAGVRWARVSRVVSLDVGIELEGIVSRFVTRANSAVLKEGHTFQLSVAPMAGIALRLWSTLYFAIRLGMRFALARPGYEARLNGKPYRLYSLSILQPVGYIGIGFEF